MKTENKKILELNSFQFFYQNLTLEGIEANTETNFFDTLNVICVFIN